MRSIFSILLAIVAATMTACAVPPYGHVKSSGMVAWNQRLTSVRVEVQPVTRVTVDITKLKDPNPSSRPPEVTESDRFAATERAKEVIGDFHSSMQFHFPALAKRHGLPLRPWSEEQSVLRLTVHRVKSTCHGARKCDVYLQVRTEVVDSTGESIWHAEVAYQPSGREMFLGYSAAEAFTSSVVAIMKRDKLLPE